jgi:hypothetical protein
MIRILCAAAGLGLLAAPAARADEPANPDLIPEARAVLKYLESIYGKKCLVGQNKFEHVEKAFQAAGKYPALASVDLSGWSKTRWDDVYQRNLQKAMDRAREWWTEKGGILSIEWHWANPMQPGGDFKHTQPKGAERPDVGKMVTPGTPEHAAALEEMRKHADYLEQLLKARVPVLWRPLHEIEGGWFWWTDVKTPENTAKLWRMMFDYFVKERKLRHLIWVYSSALKAGDKEKDVVCIDYRKRFYPGDAYVDIAGIDIYINSWFGWGDYRKEAYSKAWDIMHQLAPKKMHALCECQGIPDPEIMAKEGPKWLYCLPWYVGDKPDWNPPDWVKQVYPHEFLITLDELPKLRAEK